MSKTKVTVRMNRFPQTALALKEAVKTVVEKLTVDIASRAALLAPVDTGALAESISFETEGTFTGYEGIVYTNQEYAVPQEYGWGRNAGQPYMVPAAEQVHGSLRDVGHQIGRKVESAAKG